MSRSSDWPWAKVKYELEIRGVNLSILARRHGLTPSHFQKVKTRALPRPQRMIADALGLEPKAIWPTRYRRGGTPIRHSQWSQNSKRRADCRASRRAAA